MKIKRIEKKLALKKTTISDLGNVKLDGVRAGYPDTKLTYCAMCGTWGLTCGPVSDCICPE